MLKKKSAIFALIAVLMFAAAMYFMYRETKETYDFGDFEEDETEAEEEPATVVTEKPTADETADKAEE